MTRLLFLLSLLALACKHQPLESSFSACLEERLETFKQDQFATQIIRIDHPDGPLYWLVKGGIADEGEPIINANCVEVCVVDCECVGVTFCDESIMTAPKTVIWEQ
jgi:hypothetical protein